VSNDRRNSLADRKISQVPSVADHPSGKTVMRTTIKTWRRRACCLVNGNVGVASSGALAVERIAASDEIGVGTKAILMVRSTIRRAFELFRFATCNQLARHIATALCRQSCRRWLSMKYRCSWPIPYPRVIHCARAHSASQASSCAFTRARVSGSCRIFSTMYPMSLFSGS
jgi:hypothetical protein